MPIKFKSIWHCFCTFYILSKETIIDQTYFPVKYSSSLLYPERRYDVVTLNKVKILDNLSHGKYISMITK